MLTMNNLLFLHLLALGFLFPNFTSAQQNYSGNSALDCGSNDSTGPNSSILYTCNGQFHHCQAFLIFKSQPLFDSVPSISTLTSIDPKDLAKANNVSRFSKFPTKKEVIVPVKCLCQGKYYKAKTTFQATNEYYTYYRIAQVVYQGLSTCAALGNENPYDQYDIMEGTELRVPLRCACPTGHQIRKGTRYLLTYPVNLNDAIPDIAERFNISVKSLIEANNLEQDRIIYPDTTILIPLPTPPLSSEMLIRDDQLESSPPPVLSSLPQLNPKHGTSSRKVYVIAGVTAGCSLLVLGILLAVAFPLCKRRKVFGNCSKKKKNLLKHLRLEIASFEEVLKVFKIEEVMKATENFSPQHRIKGCVYWGKFNGEVLAVKKVKGDVSKEVKILKRTNHFNLIKLHGVCEFWGSFLLIFEYMKNGSLREWLSDQRSKGHQESLAKRVQIALDIANGLYYLHSFTKPAYVHMDITSSNVLLTDNIRAKISNFSQAKIVARETPNSAITDHVIGTRVYMAPEYLEAGVVTPKTDVYAFGVVLLELMTGKEAVFIREGKEATLSTSIVPMLGEENAEAKLASFVDPSLKKGDHDMGIALSLAKVGAACLTKDADSRLRMEEVVVILLKIQADLLLTGSTIDLVGSTNKPVPMWCPSMGEINWSQETSNSI